MATRFLTMPVKDDRRIAYQTDEWISKIKTQPKNQEARMPFITISREYGCAGFSLGELLAKEMNKNIGDALPWVVYDQGILEKIEKEYGIQQVLLQSLCDETRDEITDFFESFITARPGQSLFYQKMFMTIRALAYQGHAILIGHGSVVTTQNISAGFHVRIYASDEWKVRQIMKMNNIAEKEAAVLLKKVTKDREGYVKKYFGANLNNSNLYHLMISNEDFSREEMAEILLYVLKKKIF